MRAWQTSKESTGNTQNVWPVLVKVRLAVRAAHALFEPNVHINSDTNGVRKGIGTVYGNILHVERMLTECLWISPLVSTHKAHFIYECHILWAWSTYIRNISYISVKYYEHGLSLTCILEIKCEIIKRYIDWQTYIKKFHFEMLSEPHLPCCICFRLPCASQAIAVWKINRRWEDSPCSAYE